MRGPKSGAGPVRPMRGIFLLCTEFMLPYTIHVVGFDNRSSRILSVPLGLARDRHLFSNLGKDLVSGKTEAQTFKFATIPGTEKVP